MKLDADQEEFGVVVEKPGRWKMKLVLSFVFFAIILSCYSAFAGCRFEGVSSQECDRLTALTKNWQKNSNTFNNVRIVEVSTAADASDTASANDADAEKSTGPCWYNEENDKIEFTEASLKLADAELSSCFARAFAEARYAAVEKEWKKFLGVHETWVVKAGKPVLVETPKTAHGKLSEQSGVHALWASFATSEMQKVAEYGVSDTTVNGTATRAIASTNKRANDTASEVRKLLGF